MCDRPKTIRQMNLIKAEWESKPNCTGGAHVLRILQLYFRGSKEMNSGMDRSREPSLFNEGDGNEMEYKGVQYDKLSTEDFKGQQFKSVEEAESFYNAYAKAMGFGVRNNYKRMSTITPGRVTSLKLVCSAQGQRDVEKNKKRVRRPKKETRFNCPCLFKVRYFNKIDAYVVVDFVTHHTHPLAQAHERHLVTSHRSVQDSHLAFATSMQRVSVKACHTYEYIVNRSGGFDKAGFTIKDLYNKLDSKRREILLDGDVEAALAYMRGKIATDSQFYCKFSIDEDNRLANMFWRDSNCLHDYTCFGDVLVFDSTCKTNPYGKPLVLFVGSNNHLSTTVFGFGLLMDETVKSYTWLLETFISSMKDQKPVAVLTDGDQAMRRAIEAVLPGCPHRLCTWHISKNARGHLRNNQALSEFRRCMWEEVTPDGFERRWTAMVNRHNLHNKDWVNMMYEKRHLWAEAFVSGHFFARMRSTQRCEGMHSYMKGYLKSGVKLCELVPALDRGLLRLRNKVVIEDFKSNNSTHVLTSSLRNLEHHAGILFTDSVFELVRKEILGVGDLIISRTFRFGSCQVYVTSSYNDEDPHNKYMTSYYHDKDNPKIECSCKLFECEGIPCCHIFNVMKHERINEIISSLVLKRWTKSAKADMQTSISEGEVPNEAIEFARYGDLNCFGSKLCLLASKTKEGANILNKEFMRLEPILSGLLKHEKEKENIAASENCTNIIKDPIKVKTKGTEKSSSIKRSRKCSWCKDYGHTKTTCPQKNCRRSRF